MTKRTWSIDITFQNSQNFGVISDIQYQYAKCSTLILDNKCIITNPSLLFLSENDRMKTLSHTFTLRDMKQTLCMVYDM